MTEHKNGPPFGVTTLPVHTTLVDERGTLRTMRRAFRFRTGVTSDGFASRRVKGRHVDQPPPAAARFGDQRRSVLATAIELYPDSVFAKGTKTLTSRIGPRGAEHSEAIGCATQVATRPGDSR